MQNKSRLPSPNIKRSTIKQVGKKLSNLEETQPWVNCYNIKHDLQQILLRIPYYCYYTQNNVFYTECVVFLYFIVLVEQVNKKYLSAPFAIHVHFSSSMVFWGPYKISEHKKPTGTRHMSYRSINLNSFSDQVHGIYECMGSTCCCKHRPLWSVPISHKCTKYLHLFCFLKFMSVYQSMYLPRFRYTVICQEFIFFIFTWHRSV